MYFPVVEQICLLILWKHQFALYLEQKKKKHLFIQLSTYSVGNAIVWRVLLFSHLGFFILIS